MSADRISFQRFALAHWLPEWARTHLKQTTVEGYLSILENRIFPAVGHVKLSKVSPLHLQGIYNRLGDSGIMPATIQRTNVVASSVLKYAYRMGLIRENPCVRCELPKRQRDTELHFFDAEQAKRFLHALTLEYPFYKKGSTRRNGTTGKPEKVSGYTVKIGIPLQFQALYNLMIYGGFRRGEVCALRWSDIDFDNLSVKIRRAAGKIKGGYVIKEPKTKAGIREVVLPAVCFDLLRRWKVEQRNLAFKLGTAWKGKRGREFDSGFVFIQDEGGMMHLDTPRRKFEHIVDNYNRICEEGQRLPKIRLHDLRHTSATLLVSAGEDIVTVSHRLGHSNPAVTLGIYAHAIPQKDRAAADKLGALLAAASD